MNVKINCSNNQINKQMKEFNGELKGFPEEVVNWMLDEQEKQGNKRDVTVFEHNSEELCDGFDWEITEFGFKFCEEVILKRNFDLFFSKFPKKQEEKPKEKIVSGPAFPCTYEITIGGENKLFYHDGMSKRFYAACAAMQGFVSSNDNLKQYKNNFPNGYVEAIIIDSYRMADELLKQENL